MTRHKFLIAALLVAQLLVPGCSDGSGDGPSTADPTRQAERDRMVERQIEARGVKDPAVLGAMRRVPRHRFVPGVYAGQAHWDGPRPSGHGPRNPPPLVGAFMA